MRKLLVEKYAEYKSENGITACLKFDLLNLLCLPKYSPGVFAVSKIRVGIGWTFDTGNYGDARYQARFNIFSSQNVNLVGLPSGYGWGDQVGPSYDFQTPLWLSSDIIVQDSNVAGVVTKEEFNGYFSKLLLKMFNYAHPSSMADLSAYGITASDAIILSGYGSGLGEDGLPLTPAGPTNPTPTGTTDNTPTGNQSACSGRFTGLSWFEGGLAKWFMSCKDWSQDFAGLRAKVMSSAPMGYVGWIGIADQNYSMACAELNFNVGPFDVAGSSYSLIASPLCNAAGYAWLTYIRPIFGWIMYAAVIGFALRRSLD
jgi:hypothetical protein